MNSFFIDLNEMANKKSRMIRLWLIGAAIFIGLIAASFYFISSKNPKIIWYFVAATVYLILYIYFAWTTYKAKLYIKADDFCLEYKFGFFERSTKSIIWETVTNVKIGPTYMTFFKKSGRNRTIRVGWLPYVKVVEIKEDVIKMCDFKQVPFKKAELIIEEQET